MGEYTETVTWTALPVRRDGKDLVLAVFASPRISRASGISPQPLRKDLLLGDEALRSFHVQNWTAYVKDLLFSISFTDTRGTSLSWEQKPDQGPLDTSCTLWPGIFREETKVFTWEPEYALKNVTQINLFDSRKMIRDYIRPLYTYVGTEYRARIPRVKDIITDQAFQEKVSPFSVRASDAGKEILPNAVIMNPDVTRVMEQSLDVLQPRAGMKPMSAKVGGDQPPTLRERNELGFHEMIGALGDHPLILRKLGLVLLFTLKGEAVSGDLDGVIQVVPRDPGGPVMCNPRTHALIRSDRFFAKSKPEGVFNDELMRYGWLRDGWLDLRKARDITGTDDINAGSDSEFDLIQMDIDGTVRKNVHFTSAMINKALFIHGAKRRISEAVKGSALRAAPGTTGPAPEEREVSAEEKAGLPANRTTGISLVKHRRDAQAKALLADVTPDIARAIGGTGSGIAGKKLWMYQKDLLSRSKPDSKEVLELYAEDLLRGYRVDVQDCTLKGRPAPWQSLCRRAGRYLYKDPGQGNTIRAISIRTMKEAPGSDDEIITEGYVKSSPVAKNTKEPDHVLNLHPSLFTWSGWSLCVKRPGAPLPPEPDAENEKDIYDESVVFRPVFSVPGGSLPSLRFGHSYRLRVRAVDLAGNNMTGDGKGWQSAEGTYASQEITYRRFEPVGTPVVVRGSDFTEGESNEQLVIRSCYDPAPKEGARQYWNAGDYAKDILNPLGGAGGKYSPSCMRYIAPPKTSQVMAERHGLFDRKDEGVVRIDGSDETFQCIVDHDPEVKVVKPVEISPGTTVRPSFIYDPTENPFRYLPDPLASGALFTGLPGVPEGESHQVSFIRDEKDPWPDIQEPFRILIRDPNGTPGQAQPSKDPPPAPVTGSDTLEVFLPPGEVRVVEYNSFLGGSLVRKTPGIRNAHELMGMWNWMFKSPAPRLAMEKSRHWMVTPNRTLTLVHAVQKPLEKPSIGLIRRHISPGGLAPPPTEPPAPSAHPGAGTGMIRSVRPTARTGARIAGTPGDLRPGHGAPEPEAMSVSGDVSFTTRNLGDTFAGIRGEFAFDAKSTEKVDLLARWEEPVDTMKQSGDQPVSVPHSGYVFEVRIPHPGPDSARVWYEWEKNPQFRHEFGDTKHRWVDYFLRGTTRFREYFPEKIWEDISNITVTGDPIRVNVLSSARPAAPRVLYVVPAFRWAQYHPIIPVTGPGQSPEQQKSRLGSTLRVYLDRPWYSSGEGEKLGVVLLDSGGKGRQSTHFTGYLTKWGRDPIQWDWGLEPPADLFPGPDAFENAEKESGLTLEETESNRDLTVSVAGYDVKYDSSRKLWYADIDMNTAGTYFPFIRLALVRYQPHSVPCAELSRVVIADFVQLVPGRSATVQRNPGKQTLTVTVHGTAPWFSLTLPDVNIIGTGMPDLVAHLREIHTPVKDKIPQVPGRHPDPDIIRTLKPAGGRELSGMAGGIAAMRKEAGEGPREIRSLTVSGSTPGLGGPGMAKPGPAVEKPPGQGPYITNIIEIVIQEGDASAGDLGWKTLTSEPLRLEASVQNDGSVEWRSDAVELPDRRSGRIYRLLLREYETHSAVDRRLVYAEQFPLSF